jgi:NitT/TauT family transport system substrate-binding protein
MKTMTNSYQLSALGAGLAVAGLVLAIQPAIALDKVKVGIIPITDCAPIYLGKQKGFFANHNLDLDIESAQGGAELVNPVISGQREFGFSNVSSLMIAETRGLDLVWVAPGASSTGEKGHDFAAIVAPADSPIKSAKDLEGKIVAVNNLKNIGDTSVNASVRSAGGDPKKVKYVEIPFPGIPAALADKRIDAGWVVEPFLTIARANGAKVVSWNLVDTAPKLMIAVYFTSRKYAKEHPDVVKRFQAAMKESLAYADGHTDEVREIVPTFTRVPKDLIGKLTLPRWPSEMNVKSTHTLAELALKDGLLDKKPDLDAVFKLP